MIQTLEKTLGEFQVGEELLADAVDAVARGWHASSIIVGKLRTEADRWHTAIRQIQAPMNLADIFRAKALSPAP